MLKARKPSIASPCILASQWLMAPTCRMLVAAATLFRPATSPSLGQPADGVAQPAQLRIRENASVNLTDHVWVIPDFNVGLVPNAGIIVDSKATLVVDTGLGPRNGEAIVREMQKVSGNADVYVVTTHCHPEHSLGVGAFAGAELVMARVPDTASIWAAFTCG